MGCSFLRSAVVRSLFLVACASLCGCAQGAPFTSKSALSAAIGSCLTAHPSGENCCSSGLADCGPAGSIDMPDWDVISQVTAMDRVFKYKSDFNQDISRWDVSQVTDMENMFWKANSFDADITSWDTSSLSNPEDMFVDAFAWLAKFERKDGSVLGRNGPPSVWQRKDSPPPPPPNNALSPPPYSAPPHPPLSYLCQFPQDWLPDHLFEDPDSPGDFYTCTVYANWVTGGSSGGPTDVDASWTCAGTTQVEQYHVGTVSKFGCCGPSGRSACCSQIVAWRPGAEDECSPSPGPPPTYALPPPSIPPPPGEPSPPPPRTPPSTPTDANKTDESGMGTLDILMLLAAGSMITYFVIYQCRKGSPLRRLRDEFSKGVPLFLDDEPSNMDAGLQLAAPEPWPAPSNKK